MTKEASEILEQCIVENWKKQGKSTRLTRGAKAEMMGVSILTADKILNREGVDRASLIVAFQCLGVNWKPSYCVPEAKANETEQRSTESKPIAKNKSRGFFVVATVLLVGGLFWMTAPLVNRSVIEYGNRWQLEYRMHMDLGWNAFQIGHFKEAESEISRAYELAKKHRMADALSESVRFKGEVFAAKGYFEEAAVCLNEAYTLNNSVGAHKYAASILESLGNVEVKLGRLDEARKHYLASLDYARSFNNKDDIASAYRGLGSFELLKGDIRKSKEYFNLGLSTLGNDINPNMAIDLRARLAMVWVQEGKAKEAISVLLSCLHSWENQKHTRWIATTKLQLSRAFLANGSFDRSKQLLVQARKGFEQAGDNSGVLDCKDFEKKMESLVFVAKKNTDRNPTEFRN